MTLASKGPRRSQALGPEVARLLTSRGSNSLESHGQVPLTPPPVNRSDVAHLCSPSRNVPHAKQHTSLHSPSWDSGQYRDVSLLLASRVSQSRPPWHSISLRFCTPQGSLCPRTRVSDSAHWDAWSVTLDLPHCRADGVICENRAVGTGDKIRKSSLHSPS